MVETAHGHRSDEFAWLGAPPDGFPRSTSSPALGSSLVVAAGRRRLFGFQGFNSGAAQFVLLFDDDAVSANGELARLVVSVAAASNFSVYFGSTGRWHERGIVLCNSTTEPTLTIGAADCFFDVQYY